MNITDLNITDSMIELINNEEVLRKNAIQEAHSSGREINEKISKKMREMFESLADEEATPWLSWSMVQMCFDQVNWAWVVMHFRGIDPIEGGE